MVVFQCIVVFFSGVDTRVLPVFVSVPVSPVRECEGVRGRSSGSAGPDEAAGQPGCG